ncbi:hypothetical protein BDR22DRAFT_538659 [Usnea florida]
MCYDPHDQSTLFYPSYSDNDYVKYLMYAAEILRSIDSTASVIPFPLLPRRMLAFTVLQAKCSPVSHPPYCNALASYHPLRPTQSSQSGYKRRNRERCHLSQPSRRGHEFCRSSRPTWPRRFTKFDGGHFLRCLMQRLKALTVLGGFHDKRRGAQYRVLGPSRALP